MNQTDKCTTPAEYKSSMRKRFTKEEDKVILSLVSSGVLCWDVIARQLPGRTGRQVKDRYNSYLSQNVVCKPWSPEEDAAIISLYNIYGPKWTNIAKHLTGRSGSNVKNRWYKSLSKHNANFTIMTSSIQSRSQIQNSMIEQIHSCSSDDEFIGTSDFLIQGDNAFEFFFE